MKLRPTKSDLKTLDKLKKLTDQATYTKAILIAAEQYPIMQKQIESLENSRAEAWEELRQYEQAAGFVLDGLEVLKRLSSPDKGGKQG